MGVCVCVCVCACVRACVRACVCLCVCVDVRYFKLSVVKIVRVSLHCIAVVRDGEFLASAS